MNEQNCQKRIMGYETQYKYVVKREKNINERTEKICIIDSWSWFALFSPTNVSRRGESNCSCGLSQCIERTASAHRNYDCQVGRKEGQNQGKKTEEDEKWH